jgi:hypothetical protein
MEDEVRGDWSERVVRIMAAVVMSGPVAASAQDVPLDEEGERVMSTIISGGITGGLTCVSLAIGALDADLVGAALYVDENAGALAQDISVGGGASLREVATLYGLEVGDHAAFGRRVRSERRALLAAMRQRDFEAFHRLLAGAAEEA